ncbi:MAG: ADP-ribosylation factor-like protein [Candidatus Jordarchaeum sp.]|uniref:ADP-ribosylation factor-like protein n=1 Tax=Candidatus Jordarchaeum sp. TaxID=2823881 RepID=UPI0040490A06
MIYGLFIFDRFGNNLFHKFFGKIDVDPELLIHFVKEFTTFVQNLDQSERIECLNLEGLKFVYSIFKDTLFVFCVDQKEDEMYLRDRLVKVYDEFTKLLKNLLQEEYQLTEQQELEMVLEPEEVIEATDQGELDEIVKQEKVEELMEKRIVEKLFKEFGNVVDEIMFPFLKIAILGQGGVGKTSVLKLIMGEEPDSSHIPTVGVEVKEFDFEPKEMKLVFWDFSGQPRFRKLWQPFLEGSNIVILVTDSTIENLVETKTIYKLIKAEKPDVNVILIANKQDLPDTVPPETVGKYVGEKAHGLVAVDPNYREKMLEILKKAIIEIIETKSQQVQSLRTET